MHDTFQITEISLQSGNFIFIKHSAHTLDGILTGGGPHNQLTDHGIVINRYLIPFVHIAVYTDTDTVWFSKLLDNTRRRHEIVFRVLGTDTAFDGVAALKQLFLSEMQHLIIGNTDLFLYQVHTNYLLRNRMLYLQARIHFEEVEPTVLVYQKLDGTCTGVVHCLGCGNCLFSHLLTKFGSKKR